ncbi:MAG: 2-hydroxyacyl-CoA dehydratase subunit D [Anaerovoracaceae bacterium]|jgi:bcr-type benzoyl-CoA reductase subunit C
MNSILELLNEFRDIAQSPGKQLKKYLSRGKKIIGCFPYYVPEELVCAANMIPFGIWGATGAVKAAKEYFATFYCTIAQMGLELSLRGQLKDLSGVIIPSLCDTLRPLSQNFRIANPDIPFMFLAHPQNRRLECGIEYTISEYEGLKRKLERIGQVKIEDGELRNAIVLCNRSRKVRRRFVVNAGRYPDLISAKDRAAVLKSSYFMDKAEYVTMLESLNEKIERQPQRKWEGIKVVVSGIINDNPGLLDIFDENRIVIAADDVAHESRSFRVDVQETGDPVEALALQFAAQDYDSLLYDPEINKRPGHVMNLVRESGAEGVVFVMMQFCDPEEMEYPFLKRSLDEEGIPSVVIGFDQQMEDFGQAKTILQAFREQLS